MCQSRASLVASSSSKPAQASITPPKKRRHFTSGSEEDRREKRRQEKGGVRIWIADRACRRRCARGARDGAAPSRLHRGGRFRVVREGFRDIGLPWEEALLGIDMATLLDAREPEVVAAAARSREILTGLGARPFLDRLEAALGREAVATPARRGSETGDRTAV